MAALFESQILAKVKFDGKECTRILITKLFSVTKVHADG